MNSSELTVFVEDDLLVRRGWQYRFQKAKKNLICFDSSESFLVWFSNNKDKILASTNFCLDLDLSNGHVIDHKMYEGIKLSHILHSEGFSNLYICSATYPSELPLNIIPVFLKGFLEKHPPLKELFGELTND